MAATACAYGYRGPRPPPPLMPARPSSEQEALLGPFFNDVVKPESPSPQPPPPPLLLRQPCGGNNKALLPRHLGLCTEGLGSESSGDCDLADDDDAAVPGGGVDDAGQLRALPRKRPHLDGGSDDEEEPMAPPRARSGPRRASFPPPISVIGASGKPWLYLRPHRADGRLVLREVRIPSRELLQARREDGRFKLHFAQPQPEEEVEDLHLRHQCQGQQQQQGNE